MLTNSSSTSNDFFTTYTSCLFSKPSSIIFTVFNITNIFLHLPLSIIILKHGVQQWQKRRSTTSLASHSDCFTYSLVIMELVGVLGCFLNCCGVYKEDTEAIVFAGTLLLTFTWFGEIFFHFLTCLERYLAVVHPVTYRSLKNERGIRIRNISIGCAWLLSAMGIISLPFIYFVFINLFLLILSITGVSYYSFSVLYVLIRPRPGEQGRERVDQSKRRAFYSIMAILGVLSLRFAFGLFWTIVYLSRISADCVMMTVDVWFNLPSTLVLPVLFLHRKGVCCKNNTE